VGIRDHVSPVVGVVICPMPIQDKVCSAPTSQALALADDLDVSSARWERERAYAEKGRRRAGSEQALRGIIRLMHNYKISTNELESLLRHAKTPRRQCDYFFD
jgi:hypothetical protein